MSHDAPASVLKQGNQCCIRFCSSNDDHQAHTQILPDPRGLEANNSKVKVNPKGINKVTTFKVPKDAGHAIILQWIKEICSVRGQCFDSLNDELCAKHFKDDCIQKFDIFYLHGRKYSVPKSLWTLKADAVPTLFETRSKETQGYKLLHRCRFESWYWCGTCKCFLQEKVLESHIQKSAETAGGHRISFVGRSPMEIRISQLKDEEIAAYITQSGQMKLRPKPKKSYSSVNDEDDLDQPKQRSVRSKARRKQNDDDDFEPELELLEKKVRKRPTPNNEYFYLQYCGICVSPAFTSRTKLGQHMKSNHLVNGRYECPHCSGFNCTSVKVFNQHHNRYHMKRSKEFKKRILKQKVQTCPTKRNGTITKKNSKIQFLYCLLCVSPAFDNQFVYSTHMKQIHMINESYYECPHCPGCKYGSVTRLNEHLKNNHLRASGYFAGRNPKSHSWKIEPFTCKQPKCNFMCRRLAKFQVHMKEKHNEIYTESMGKDIVSRKKRFTCSICNFAFRKRDHLKRHVYAHLKKPGLTLAPESKDSTSSTATLVPEVEVKVEGASLMESSSSSIDLNKILPVPEQIPILEKIPKFESDLQEDPISYINIASHPNSTYMKELIKILGPQYKGNFHICHLCPEMFKREMYLKRHLETNHKVVCDPSMRISSIRQHPVQSTNTKLRLSCGACGLTSENPSELTEHMKTHNRGNYRCSLCGRCFFTEAKRNAHVKLIHQTKRKFSCKLCPKKFLTAKSLQAHKSTIHNRKRSKEQCDQCDKVYWCKGSLVSHKKTAHRARPICQICGESRVNYDSLRRHVRLIHLKPTTASEEEGSTEVPEGSGSGGPSALDLSDLLFL